jgi:hypothetical protein
LLNAFLRSFMSAALAMSFFSNTISAGLNALVAQVRTREHLFGGPSTSPLPTYNLLDWPGLYFAHT